MLNVAYKNSALLTNIRNMGKRNQKTIGIIGAGRFGTSAARELLANGHEILLIDNNVKRLESLAGDCTTAIGDAESPEFLEEAGIKEVDAVIVAIGENESASNHAVINCKDFGLFVVAKATDATHGKILDRLGADYVVYPERDSATRLARFITRSSILDMVELYDKVFMMEINATGPIVNRPLESLDLPNTFGVQVVTILRGDETVFPVSATDVAQEGDRVVVLGPEEALQKLAKAVGPS
ncbi:potassium channel family protein [Alicyclobacillus dauci]|uniref:Trk system potassium uptake protein TrkA n=1 Tax=Alicyclobacillus dauci TaxID=1475485 RepID=A0ABY6Z6D2_9BACL|nr:TrkA family potassium uptake protein [Alicyclobacillus dauci]WAH38305.1 TrkA family potassium uptake protein [Alicyclobacillus dauci]